MTLILKFLLIIYVQMHLIMFWGNIFLNSFSLSHVNIRLLHKNFDELCLLFDNLESKFDVITLSEVWNVSDTALFSLTGYTLEVKCRKGNARERGCRSLYSFIIKICHSEF